jgi:hypothetical protein
LPLSVVSFIPKVFYRSEGRKIADVVEFFYRINADKTIDSICGFCYLTVAAGESEAELHTQEAAHDCWKKRLTDNQADSE